MMAARARVELAPLHTLQPHEHTIPSRVAEVLASIAGSGLVYKPIIVDADTYTVIDGHHRLQALRLLGARHAPVVLVDYERDVRAIRVDPKPLTPLLARRLGPHLAPTGTPGVYTLKPTIDPLEAYKALAQAPTGPSKHLLQLPPIEPWIVRSLASTGLLLPPKTTIHETWAKKIVAPTSLHALL